VEVTAVTLRDAIRDADARMYGDKVAESSVAP